MGLGDPPAICGPLGHSGQPFSDLCAGLLGRSEGVALDSGSASMGGVQEVSPRFVGPFTRVISLAAVKLHLLRSMRVDPTFLKLVHESPLAPARPLSPLPCHIDGGPAFTAQCLICSRQCGRGLHYLVDWEGYGPDESSWVSA